MNETWKCTHCGATHDLFHPALAAFGCHLCGHTLQRANFREERTIIQMRYELFEAIGRENMARARRPLYTDKETIQDSIDRLEKQIPVSFSHSDLDFLHSVGMTP